jgi:peptidoglycan/xylan/chitin deacetylase (PgdA/CDA1 family)
MRLVDQDVPGPRRDFVGYGRRLPKVVWPDGAKVAVNLIVNYEEGSEYSIPAGDNRNEGLAEIPYVMPGEYRDLNAESIYEFGSRAGIMRLLRLFDEYGLRVTFYAAAVAVERNPEVGDWIHESGHEPAGHGWRWTDPVGLERDEERRQIEAAVRSLEETCGERPVGWFSRYSASASTRELLVEEGGFIYDSDAFADDLPYFTEVSGKRHLLVPYTLVYNDGRYVLPQGFGSPSDFVETCKRGLDELLREGRAGYPKMMSVGLHARWSGQAARTSGLRQFIEYALEQDDVWFARRDEIARWWIDHHEEFER